MSNNFRISENNGSRLDKRMSKSRTLKQLNNKAKSRKIENSKTK